LINLCSVGCGLIISFTRLIKKLHSSICYATIICMKSLGRKKIRMSQGRGFILYLSLIVHVLVGVGSAAGGVICFKKNGRAAVEHSSCGACRSSSHSTAHKCGAMPRPQVTKPCCKSSKPAVQPAFMSMSPLKHPHMASHCRTCLDISTLIAGVTQSSIHSQSILPLPKVEAFLVSFSTHVSQKISKGTFISQSLSPQTLAMQRTVVLLI